MRSLVKNVIIIAILLSGLSFIGFHLYVATRMKFVGRNFRDSAIVPLFYSLSDTGVILYTTKSPYSKDEISLEFVSIDESDSTEVSRRMTLICTDLSARFASPKDTFMKSAGTMSFVVHHHSGGSSKTTCLDVAEYTEDRRSTK